MGSAYRLRSFRFLLTPSLVTVSSRLDFPSILFRYRCFNLLWGRTCQSIWLMFHKSISRRRADVPIRVRERIVHVKSCANKKRVVARRTPDQDERHRSDKPLRFSSLIIYFCICSRLSGGDPPVPPVATLLPGYFYKQATGRCPKPSPRTDCPREKLRQQETSGRTPHPGSGNSVR